jgi:5-methylcytosine-specific restriction enzyme B
MFTWIPIHRDAIHRILEYRGKEKELLTVLREMEKKGLKVISLQDEDQNQQKFPLAVIDPFTFLASFNRGITDENRKENWRFLKARWNLNAAVPEDFTGIPVLHNMSSWLFPYASKRQSDHTELLWQLAWVAADGDIGQVGEDLFNRCVNLNKVSISNLTIGIFWINPHKFLPADNKTSAYGEAKGIPTKPEDYKSYQRWLNEMTDQVGSNYPQVSHEAHLFSTRNQSNLDLTSARMQPLWERFHRVVKGFIDFQNPGADFVANETGYKRAVLKKFRQELGAEKLSAFVAQGHGTKAAKEIIRVLTSNLVSFHAWNLTLGETEQATCNVVREFLKATSAPYKGAESTKDLFDTCARHNLKPNWDALTVLLWALRPEDFFPVKISFYRKLGTELDSELPSGRPDANKLHSVIEFGRAFWKALEPQKPSDWVDIQSFIWCVCPDNEQEQIGPESAPQTDYLQETPPRSQAPQYWVFSPGTGAEEWEEFRLKGIMAIGWDELGDLSNFKTDEEISQKLQKLRPNDKFPTMDTLACWEFVHDIKIGDVIFVNQGRDKIVGYGVVEGDYEFADERPYYKHVRKVKWLAKGRWELPEGEKKVHAKTLTGITDPARIAVITKLVGLDIGATAKTAPIKVSLATGICYWWLNANPKIWNLEDWSLGRRQTYTSHNEKGNKRQKYRYFQEVKPGDLVIGYVTSPQKEVVAVCKITKALHQTDEGEKIEIEKIEELVTPVAYEALQANPDLANCEPLINNQGSLFKLTEPEYEIIRSLIDDTNIQPKTEIELYDKKKSMKGLFLKGTQFDEMLAALKEKKNVVLQGAPGVGKTYVAKRLAYALVGSNDPLRVEMIQFHQSYSYEDFIQGFRPTIKGHFDLKSGIFHQFCRRAQRDEANGTPYVFIIDEINRGNLSKIFGELMMLIEPDKRGKEHAIPLAYCQDGDDKFYIPENLYLIGMMNTADRSLAMVDYALRRRFRFVTLRPEFSSKTFREFLIEAGAWRELADKIVTRMNALNEVIGADTKNLGPGYQIGHSYFCPRNGTKPDDGWYLRVIESEIVPLIQEYWFDNEQKVKDQRSALLA